LAVTLETVEAHIETWAERFKKSAYPYRQNWPPRLFRHEPVENAAVILRAGRLLCRNAARGLAPKDIADKGVIATRDESHKYARLYFRPKTPTQYHIEGIRKPSEYYHGDPDAHAAILVILIFRIEGLLMTAGVRFSDGNMQSGVTALFSTDEEFRNLPFEMIYHVGPVEVGSDITRCRCAEVLVPDELILDDRLQAVLCRSPAERATLLHMLGDAAENWSPIIRVYTEPGIFENRYAYVDSVAVAREGVRLTMHPRLDAQPVRVDIAISSRDRGVELKYFHAAAPAGHAVMCTVQLQNGEYLVQISVDGCLAYRGISLVDDLPF
jgi:hypothetical protein